ncbi:putative integrase domain protein [Clostridioides difficile CD160]|nr:putative integrase domain protein [Clostridioides difficile CD160]
MFILQSIAFAFTYHIVNIKHVRKRDKKWYYYFDTGIVDGKRKKVEKVGGETKKEAEKALRDAINEFENSGTVFDETNISLSDYLDF